MLRKELYGFSCGAVRARVVSCSPRPAGSGAQAVTRPRRSEAPSIPLLSMCSPCSSWTMAVCVAGTITMLPSSRPQTKRPCAGMYTLAVTLSGSLMFGIKLSWSIIPAGRGVSLSKASWRDTEVVVGSPV